MLLLLHSDEWTWYNYKYIYYAVLCIALHYQWPIVGLIILYDWNIYPVLKTSHTIKRIYSTEFAWTENVDRLYISFVHGTLCWRVYYNLIIKIIIIVKVYMRGDLLRPGYKRAELAIGWQHLHQYSNHGGSWAIHVANSYIFGIQVHVAIYEIGIYILIILIFVLFYCTFTAYKVPVLWGGGTKIRVGGLIAPVKISG